jgi:hypothetical protein
MTPAACGCKIECYFVRDGDTLSAKYPFNNKLHMIECQHNKCNISIISATTVNTITVYILHNKV